jgi:hypothetical protein
MVDLMLWTSGRDFKEVASFQTRVGFPEIGDAENSAASLFRMDNGGAATLRMDYLRPETAPSHGDDRLRLAGTKGIAEYYNTGGVTLVSVGRKLEQIRDLPPEGSVFIGLPWVSIPGEQRPRHGRDLASMRSLGHAKR